MLSSKLSTPSSWTYQGSEVIEVELSSYTSEYNKTKSILEEELLENLEKITRVQNPYLYHRYQIRKLEYQHLGIAFSERQLVHATAQSKVSSIIADNLDWRRVSRAKFGQGVSFSPCPDYANTYCARSNGQYRAMIVAKVLVGQAFSGGYSTNVAPKGFDTSVGNCSRVYVKFYDDEFYPEYVAYYKDY